MLKKRIIPTLLYKDYGLVKGVGFDSWRRTGSAMQQIKVYNMRKVDELVFLDIAATLEKRPPDFELIDQLADDCFMPLTVGGGISSLDDAYHLLQVGADKVALNSLAIEKPDVISQISSRFGSQFVVISIDYKWSNGRYEVFSHSGKKPTGLDPIKFAVQMEQYGAGEILLTSIERDGTMQGYDMDLTRQVADNVKIPVIISGGAGTYEHFFEGFAKANASAVAAASMFHFTSQTPLEAKQYLREKNIAVR